jgi:hypothetical protein
MNHNQQPQHPLFHARRKDAGYYARSPGEWLPVAASQRRQVQTEPAAIACPSHSSRVIDEGALTRTPKIFEQEVLIIQFVDEAIIVLQVE